MQATIYVTNEAMATAIAIKDLDYYTRVSLSDTDETDLSNAAGYYLKNARMLNLAALPASARIALRLNAGASNPASCTVSMPTHLRGCIFENAPNLPERYADNIGYWSGAPLNAADSRAVHFQNPQNEYLVELRPAKDTDECVAVDKLVSEGVVVSIQGLGNVITALASDDFIEITIPIDQTMVGNEPETFRTATPYSTFDKLRHERIFIKVADITQSPNPDHILIDLLRHELLDYGYWY